MTAEELQQLPPADAEQAHLEDEIQHPDFFDTVHHPAGHTTESEDQ